MALEKFYAYIFEALARSANQEIDPPYKWKFLEAEFQTQVTSLPVANKYLSILITNEPIMIKQDIAKINRRAVYDGVIAFDNDLVCFIENKPTFSNVWENQLCPAQKDIPEDSILLNRPAVLEWKVIINFLHNINNNPNTSNIEKHLISDFFIFINEKFDYLNPYNEFKKCHSPYLANRRIEKILMEIAFNEELVSLHSGWGYHIQLDFPEIKKIALLLNSSDEDWTGLIIAADFGSTVSQARHLYNNISDYSLFETYNDWSTYCNLHLAFQSTNLVHLSSPEGVNERYFNYWKSDVWTNFGGKPKEELRDNLEEYKAEGIINYDAGKQLEVTSKIFNKGYQRINICPALYQEYYISRKEAENLDDIGQLAEFIKMRMKEVLSKLAHPVDQVFK